MRELDVYDYYELNTRAGFSSPPNPAFIIPDPYHFYLLLLHYR